MSINKQAIGIHIIQRDKAGAFPRILANLSGIEFKQADCTQGYKIPSFHYSRYQNCTYGKKQDGKYFYYTADITLEKQEDAIKDNEEAKGAVVLSLPSPDPSSSERENKRENIIKDIDKLLFNSDRDNRLGRVKIDVEKYIDLDQGGINNKEFVYKLLTQECIFQVTTSPETYRAKLFNLFKNWDFYKEFKEKEAGYEIRRAYIDTTFSYSDGIPKGSPLAKLYLCCRYGDRPGSLAAAINTLLFREWKNTQDKNKIFNIMFYMDYFSFAPSVAYDAIYGHLEDLKDNSNRICKEQSKDVIERILICPITGEGSWSKYADNLLNFLNNKNVENKYIIMKPEKIKNDQSIPNILIYRDKKSPFKICEIRDDGERRLPNKGCDICRKYWWPPTGLNPPV